MEDIERGCVYFFRHIGLSPVKIGFSTNESPISRFEQFKTYAPYGAELLGFIMCKNSKELETILHERFSANRLKGEWFDISEKDIKKVVNFYSNLEDIKLKNDFEIEWAKKINFKKIRQSDEKGNIFIFDSLFSKEKNENFKTKVVLNKSEISDFLKIDKKELDEIIDFYQLEYKTRWSEGSSKKGFLLYQYKQ